MICGWGGHSIWGIVLKGCSISKVEKHCSRGNVQLSESKDGIVMEKLKLHHDVLIRTRSETFALCDVQSQHQCDSTEPHLRDEGHTPLLCLQTSSR